jgi:hypothetical protein
MVFIYLEEAGTAAVIGRGGWDSGALERLFD